MNDPLYHACVRARVFVNLENLNIQLYRKASWIIYFEKEIVFSIQLSMQLGMQILIFGIMYNFATRIQSVFSTLVSRSCKCLVAWKVRGNYDANVLIGASSVTSNMRITSKVTCEDGGNMRMTQCDDFRLIGYNNSVRWDGDTAAGQSGLPHD